jgi:hypothetical protein
MALISRLLETVTGKDDLERLADKGHAALLDRYLESRRLFFPKRPRRFLDPAKLAQDELIRLIREEGEETSGDRIEFWVLEVAGKRRLPAFSSLKKAQVFSVKMSQDLNLVFGLGCLEMLLTDALKYVDVDFIDVNLFSKKSWALEVGARTSR